MLNSLSYGYDITCTINGHDLGLAGGKSESQREFAEGSKDSADFSPGERGKYAPLHIGRNSVKITYKRKLPAMSFGLDMARELQGYPAPPFYVNLSASDRGSGTFAGTFDIADKPPAGFKPLVFATSDPATSGLLYVDQDRGADGFLLPLMNGEGLGKSLEHGQTHVVIWFDGLHPGANTLSIECSTKGGPLHLYILGPRGASTHVLRAARKMKASFTVQGPDHSPSKR